MRFFCSAASTTVNLCSKQHADYISERIIVFALSDLRLFSLDQLVHEVLEAHRRLLSLYVLNGCLKKIHVASRCVAFSIQIFEFMCVSMQVHASVYQ